MARDPTTLASFAERARAVPARGIRFDQLGVGLLFVAIAASAALMPAQNDTFWHLRAGRELWQTGRVPMIESYSHTAAGRPWPNHEWLWQALTYPLWLVGGFPLLTAVAAAITTAAWGLVYRLMRGGPKLRFAVLAAVVPLASIVWALRPQLVTMLMLAALLALLCARRLAPVPLLFLLWANFHGAVALGGAVLVAVTALAFVVDPKSGLRHLAACVASAAATLVTPMGLGLLRFVRESIGRSTSVRIAEWRPVAPLSLVGVYLAVIVLALAALLVTRRQRLTSWSDRVLLVASLLLLPLALRYVRNVPAFLVAAAPLATRLLAVASPAAPPPVSPDHPRLNLALFAGLTAGLVAMVALCWSKPVERLGWRPVSAAAIAAVRACPGKLYNRYDEGGFLIWLAPERPVYIDSRQDPYPPELVAAHVEEEDAGLTPAQLGARGIRCAFLPPQAKSVETLGAGGWRELYRDEATVVLAERDPGAFTRGRDDRMQSR
jgi:hypothetical protein